MGHAQDEFADFYRASRDSCLKAVTAITGDPELAEELLAEAFARAWTSWGKVRGHAAPRAWVVRTALNLGVSWCSSPTPSAGTRPPRPRESRAPALTR